MVGVTQKHAQARTDALGCGRGVGPFQLLDCSGTTANILYFSDGGQMGSFATAGLGGLPRPQRQTLWPCVIYLGADEAPPERNLLLPIFLQQQFCRGYLPRLGDVSCHPTRPSPGFRSVSPVSGSFRTEFGEAAQRSISHPPLGRLFGAVRMIDRFELALREP